jgi:hypothetical protein
MIDRQRHRPRLARLAAAPLALAWILAGLAPADAASAAPCVSVTGAPPPSIGTSVSDSVRANGVAIVSACDAWMVGGLAPEGDSGTSSTLIEHWNGSNWSVLPSPSPGSSSLASVSAPSATNAWAVGSEEDLDIPGGELDGVIEHWDGTSWKQQSMQAAGFSTQLAGVSAVTPTNAWAVGSTDVTNADGSASNQPLIEHWGGSSWSVVPSPSPDPSPGTRNILVGVAAASATEAWAVGDTVTGGFFEHWNGSTWSLVSPANPAIGSFRPRAVAVTSATDAWAAGYVVDGQSQVPVLEHWNGSAWSVVSAPIPGGAGNVGYFTGVAASSTTDAWAVGVVSATSNQNPGQAFIEHWDGSTWSQVPIPNVGEDSIANAVAVAPNRTGWVAGELTGVPSGDFPLSGNFALHLQCC